MSFNPSQEPDLSEVVTTPTLPTDTGIVYTPKEFSDALTLDLTDEEIQRAMEITLRIRRKYSAIFRSKFAPHTMAGGSDQLSRVAERAMEWISQFEDELRTTLAEQLHVLASVDAEPVLFGDPPVIVFEGALPSHTSAIYGQDHEKKEWEVKRAKARGQDFLGIDKIGE